MRICPVCNQNYADDSLNFCLIDGTGLRQSNDEPRTEKFSAEQKLSIGKNQLDSPTGRINARQTVSDSRSWKNLSIALGGLILLFGGVFIVWFAFVYSKNENKEKPANTPGISNTESKTNAKKTDEDQPLIKLEMYQNIKAGMTYNEVVQIVGSEGDELFSTGTAGKLKMSSVRWGNPFVYIMVTFQNDKVLMKTQNGLE